MRHLKNFVWFAVGMVLVGVPMFSFAGTYPASLVYPYGGVNYPDPAGACAAWAAATTNPVVTYTYNKAQDGTSSFLCYGSYVSPGGTTISNYFYGLVSPSYKCVNGGTLSGHTCTKTCPSGQELESDGQCLAPCAAGEIRGSDGVCVSKCVSLAGSSNSFWTGYSYCGKGSQPASLCLDGCAIALGGLGIAFGSEWCSEVGKYTGGACSGESPAGTGESDGKVAPEGEKLPKDSPEKKCVDQGQGFGSVNGVVVCVDPTTTTGKKTDTTKTTDSTGQTTTSTTTTDTKTVKNPDGSTTTITTVTNPDGTKTETTTTTSGSANGGGNGKGDGDFGWGEPGNEGALTEKEAGVSSLIPVEIASGASCPPPVVLPHGWGEVKYDLACSLADKIRPIVLAFAWLVAGLIVIGGVKGD